MKDRTKQEPSDPTMGRLPNDAERLGIDSTQRGGNRSAAEIASRRMPEGRAKRGNHSEASAETETWLEQVLEASNMHSAWQKVRSNRGAPGMDGMTIHEFPAFAREHWERIRSQLKEGTYRPAPVRRVFIPKPDGSQRPLGVPTVLDRVIQQAIAQVLTPLYDGEFSDQSYGFDSLPPPHPLALRVLLRRIYVAPLHSRGPQCSSSSAPSASRMETELSACHRLIQSPPPAPSPFRCAPGLLVPGSLSRGYLRRSVVT
jgi:Reverse transcriptase (RNA-dependent DNA polymerase)